MTSLFNCLVCYCKCIVILFFCSLIAYKRIISSIPLSVMPLQMHISSVSVSIAAVSVSVMFKCKFAILLFRYFASTLKENNPSDLY